MTRLPTSGPRSFRPAAQRAARLAGLAVAATCAGLLTGCGAGNNAPTSRPYNVADGLQHVQGTIRVLNALVIAGDNGGGSLSMTIANTDSSQKLTLQSVEVGKASAALAAPKGDVGPRQTLSIGPGMKVQLNVPAGTVKAGNYVPLVLHFSGEQSVVTMSAAVVAPDLYYASVAPTPGTAATPADGATDAPDPAAVVQSGAVVEPSDAPSS